MSTTPAPLRSQQSDKHLIAVDMQGHSHITEFMDEAKAHRCDQILFIGHSLGSQLLDRPEAVGNLLRCGVALKALLLPPKVAELACVRNVHSRPSFAGDVFGVVDLLKGIAKGQRRVFPSIQLRLANAIPCYNLIARTKGRRMKDMLFSALPYRMDFEKRPVFLLSDRRPSALFRPLERQAWQLWDSAEPLDLTTTDKVIQNKLDTYEPGLRNPTSYDVFLSYASADSALAKRLNAEFRRKRLRCFMAERDVRSGEKWQDTIRDALTVSKEIVIVLTPTSLTRPWVLIEAGAAWALGKRITPCLKSGEMRTLPELFSANQGRDISNPAQRAKLAKEIADRLL